jgi:hypothetical protein
MTGALVRVRCPYIYSLVKGAHNLIKQGLASLRIIFAFMTCDWICTSLTRPIYCLHPVDALVVIQLIAVFYQVKKSS